MGVHLRDTKRSVIPSQWRRPASLALSAQFTFCAHWRGNPFFYQAEKENTDCHTSDIGHWFAMTKTQRSQCSMSLR